MGMAVILVMWPGPFEQTFVPLSHGGCIWNWASTGPVASEEKMFKNVDVRRTTDGGPCLYYKLASEPKGSGELKMYFSITFWTFYAVLWRTDPLKI